MLARQGRGVIGICGAGNGEAQHAIDGVQLQVGKAAGGQRFARHAQVLQGRGELAGAAVVVFRQHPDRLRYPIQAPYVGHHGVVGVARTERQRGQQEAGQHQHHRARGEQQELAGAGDRARLAQGRLDCPRIGPARNDVSARGPVVHGAFAEHGLLDMVEHAGQGQVQGELHQVPPQGPQQAGTLPVARDHALLEQLLAGRAGTPGVHQSGQQQAEQARGQGERQGAGLLQQRFIAEGRGGREGEHGGDHGGRIDHARGQPRPDAGEGGDVGGSHAGRGRRGQGRVAAEALGVGGRVLPIAFGALHDASLILVADQTESVLRRAGAPRNGQAQCIGPADGRLGKTPIPARAANAGHWRP